MIPLKLILAGLCLGAAVHYVLVAWRRGAERRAHLSRIERAEQQLRRRLDLEELIATISTRFLNLPSDRVEACIRESIERLAVQEGADAACVHRLAEDHRTFRLVHFWSRDPEDTTGRELLGEVDAEQAPWLMQRLLLRGAAEVLDMEELPPEAWMERGLLSRLGFRSGIAVPMKHQGRLQGVVGFYFREPRQEWDAGALLPLRLIGQVLAGAFRRMQYELEREQSELRERAARERFTRELIDSQEHERQRIARELHDGLGQNLILTRNRALMAQELETKDEEVKVHLGAIADAVSAALDEVREISRNLHPYQLDHVGLSAAISSLMRQSGEATGIRFSSRVEPAIDGLAEAAAINVFRIVQESINNVVRHSRATEAGVIIEDREGGFQLEVWDNGAGFAVPGGQGAPRGSGFSGLGLVSMAERARILGGDLRIDSTPGEGTRIRVRLPADDRKASGPEASDI